MPAVRRIRRTTDDATEERTSRVRNPRPARDEDEDETPRSTRLNTRGRAKEEPEEDAEESTPATGAKGAIRQGWDGYRQTKSETGGFGERLVIEKEPHLIKFVDDAPYASFGQHWVDNPPAPYRKRSWLCIKKDCPLCSLGDRPRAMTYFTVILMDTGGDPELRSLEVGPTMADQLYNFSQDSKTGPLSRLYWAVNKSGKQQTAATNIVPVKERDLAEDWPEIEPLTDEEFDEFVEQRYTEKMITLPTRKQLEEIAEALADE